MDCKCGARTIEAHTKKISAGYSGHVYTGFFWSAPANWFTTRTTEKENGS